MKIFILIAFVVFPKLLFAQDYKPLLDEYNEWNLRYCFEVNLCSTDVYYTNGDTVVDGMEYKILDGYHYISRGFLLREDIAQRKVYLKTILPGGIRDYLLYDFSMNVGDSIDIKNPITPFLEDAGYFTMDSIILRPLVDGNEYRHFYLSPSPSNTVSTNNAIWVEGVGSLSIITAPGGNPDVNSVGRVACMFKNGESFYSDLTIIDECEPTFILGNDEFETIKPTVQIIKKTTEKEFEIINIKAYKTITLFNLQGVKIDFYKTNNQNSMVLNLSNYQAGVYLLMLESNEYPIQTLKILIQ